jgi:hypothetical protein
MDENRQERVRGPRGNAAGIVALVAFAAAALAWWWTARQPPLQPDAGLGLSYGVIVIGGGAGLLALIAQIRAMSFMDLLELLLSAVLGLFRLIGAMLKGLWSLICGLFGWD